MGIKTRLFGGFSIQVNDVEISSLNSRHQALLAYLAIHHPKPVPRSELAFTLWADSNEEQALTNLRKALHHIKQKLDNGEVIQIDSRTLQLNSKIQIDLTDFSAALDFAERARRARDAEAEQNALETAAAFYRGGLLPNFYDEWLIRERDRLRDMFIRGMDRLIVLLETRKHYRDAIQYAQSLLQTDNLREETYRTLVRLHALNNDRAAALNVYHICAGVLSKELGVEPDASTRELYERLLKSESQLLRVFIPARPISTPLVAREQEWRQLVAEWKQASNGELRTVLLSGEVGIGKTRLAEDFLHWASRQGIRTASARCYSAEGRISFAPVVGWVRSMPLQGLDAHWRSELSRILPELRSRDLASQPMTENWQKQVFFESMARAMLAENEPLVLLLDDIQWCDNDTLDWLRYFLHFVKTAKMFLLVTLRSEELPSNHELQMLLVDLRAAGQLTEMELSRLDEKQTAELGAHLLSKNLSEADAASLFHESEGVPLFVVELANVGVKRESARVMETGTRESNTSLPPRLKAVLEGRLARLSSPARAVVESAAVIGREFDFNLLRKVSELEESITVNSLDELWRLRMVRERGGRYDFSHDKLREAALAGISPIRLRWLHQRVGEALEADQATVEYQRIADHFERAGMQNKALGHYVRAAGQAQQLFALTEALDYLRRAILLETKHDMLANLHEQRGNVLMLLGRNEDSYRAFDQALGIATGFLQKARLARKQVLLANRYDNETSRQKYEAALEALYLAQDDPGYWHEWIEIQLTWIISYYWRQELASMDQLLEETRRPVMEHGTLGHQIKYHARVIDAALIRERYMLSDQHITIAQENADRAVRLGDLHQVSVAKEQLAVVIFAAGQFDIAETAFREAIELSEKNGDSNSLLIARVYLSLSHRRLKKVEDVEADTQALSELLEKLSGSLHYEGVIEANRAWLAYRAGKINEARRNAHRAMEIWNSSVNPYPAQWPALFVLLTLAVEDRDLDDASVHAKAMLVHSQQRLTVDVESALLAALEVDPSKKEVARNRLKEAVAKAKEAGYL